MAHTKKTKGPAIPESQRIKYVLDDIEDSFQKLQGLLRKHQREPLSEAEIQALSVYWDDFAKDLIKLVHLDNTQLHHPYVQHYLLSWPKNKDFVRKLHRGLETGVKRQIKEKELPILVGIYEGEEKGCSLHQTQRGLERKGLIKSMSRQAFHKLAKRLLSSTGGKGPFYNPSALPPKPEHLPEHVQEAWDKAAKNLQELSTTPEKQKELYDSIERRRSIQKAATGKS